MSKSFDRYSGMVFFAIGLAFVIESRKITESAYGSNVGPDIFPLGLGLALILLSIRLFYETFKYPKETKMREKLDYKKFVIILISAVLYGLFLETIGYVITTFLFLIVGFQVMERGKWWKSLVIAGGFSYGVYFLFVEILEGTLPGFPVWFS
ncbi:tripartite tricarboxylate transporter TctB family protein [Metabacillus endolithicus]|uniref:Tripartite tricarboxylate transporter TctB family protein n=1 Tax=Metabacillus endolithicus TaxID=1535204 RepID=A0ABW5C1K3_9BACI|nr:tripartite tricarboxylate transporter TctB family protein [Metabacillus endolithicus]UPG62503.1 tripartite tricarboxylate transporter TctB family protein [Metabacillus endolithicus]